MNLVRAVREAAGLSKSELADAVGKATSTVAAWELEPDSKEANILADLAEKHGLHKEAHELRVTAGGPDTKHPAEMSLEELSGDERQLAEWLIAKYRDPKSNVEKALIQLVWAIRNNDQIQSLSVPSPAIASLSEEHLQTLEEFVKKPEAMMIVSAIVRGGNPPSAFAVSGKEQKSTGEHIAKRKRS